MSAPAEPDALDFRKQIEALARRVSGFSETPGEVDLRTADPLLYGVPRRSHVPGLAQVAWDRAFGFPLTVEPFRFLFSTEVRVLRHEVRTLPSSPSRFETSRNWSGAYVTANQGRHFGQIWGFWQIPPTLSLPPPPFNNDPSQRYLAVNWIGLDGQRDYLNSSLPQIGTQAELFPETGNVVASTWMQWWARDDDHTLGPLPIGLDASPGDLIAAVLTVTGPSEVWGTMVNLSTRRFGSRSMTAPPVLLPDGTHAKPVIEGATAEWIMERSQVLGATTANNLPNYGTTKFELCVAVEALERSAQSVLDGVPHVLSGVRYIRMFDTLNSPVRTAYVSMPNKLDELTLEIKYGGFPS